MRIERVIACLDVGDGEVVQGSVFARIGKSERFRLRPSVMSAREYVVCVGACASILVIGKALDEDRLHLAGARP